MSSNIRRLCNIYNNRCVLSFFDHASVVFLHSEEPFCLSESNEADACTSAR